MSESNDKNAAAWKIAAKRYYKAFKFSEQQIQREREEAAFKVEEARKEMDRAFALKHVAEAGTLAIAKEIREREQAEVQRAAVLLESCNKYATEALREREQEVARLRGLVKFWEETADAFRSERDHAFLAPAVQGTQPMPLVTHSPFTHPSNEKCQACPPESRGQGTTNNSGDPWGVLPRPPAQTEAETHVFVQWAGKPDYQWCMALVPDGPGWQRVCRKLKSDPIHAQTVRPAEKILREMQAVGQEIDAAPVRPAETPETVTAYEDQTHTRRCLEASGMKACICLAQPPTEGAPASEPEARYTRTPDPITGNPTYHLAPDPVAAPACPRCGSTMERDVVSKAAVRGRVCWLCSRCTTDLELAPPAQPSTESEEI